jgi:3-hydroxy-3-methylglutaryl CoA synthase
MARTVVYGTNRLTVEDDNLNVDQIKASMSEIFAELANATAEVRGNEVHFTVKAGTKGARTVVYGTNRLTVEDDNLNVDQIKASMSEIFAELANATAEVRGNEVHFTVKAGTKGMARTVVYGTNRLTVEDDNLSTDQIKASMSEIFAELANATAEVRGNEVHFTVKAGTKGARTVVYGTNRLTVEDDKLTPEEIKRSMSEIFAELANATYEVRGTEVHFTVKAGTKGLSYTVVVNLKTTKFHLIEA